MLADPATTPHRTSGRSAAAPARAGGTRTTGHRRPGPVTAAPAGAGAAPAPGAAAAGSGILARLARPALPGPLGAVLTALAGVAAFVLGAGWSVRRGAAAALRVR